MAFKLNDTDRALLQLAVAEDLGQPPTDITSEALFATSNNAYEASIVSKQSLPITMAGLVVLEPIFKALQADVQINIAVEDGKQLLSQETALTLTGDEKAILKAERLVLNYLRHLSAIATLTRRFAAKTRGTKCRILDTRKTTPGLRHLEKYAVECGGGINHRIGLYDAYMVKDTHVDALGGMQEALSRLPTQDQHDKPVIVEVRSLEELNSVLTHGQGKVSRVLLDNMSLEMLGQAVTLCKGVLQTEASGNISLETIASIAKTGVDYASVGMITHSAGQVDLSMLYTAN